MADNTQTPGDFNWLELQTSDSASARAFYTALFDWEYAEVPLGPDDTYTIFNIGGKTTAAAYQLGSDMLAQGIPPHWGLYVSVIDADASAAKAQQLGGTVPMEPFDVMDQVRMAVLQDPTGAQISIAQPINNTGLGLVDKPGSFVWTDLFSPDSTRAAEFYCGLFGWTTYVGDSPYIHFKNGEKYIAGSMPGTLQPGMPPHWLPYIGVESCDAGAEKAKSLGATVHYGPVTMEGIGRYAVLADPQGAVFAVFESGR